MIEEEPDFTPAFLREARAVLIRRGALEIDPRFRYSHTDRGLIAARGLDILESVFVGELLIGSVDRDTLGPSLSFRYGLADRLQINASVPYRFQYNEDFIPFQIVRLQPGEEGGIEIETGLTSETQNHGLGDIEFGFSYHLFRERPFLPDTIFTVGFKTATGDGPFDVQPGESSTGTGYLGVRGGLTFVRVSDPAVLFANVGYFLHLEDESEVPGAGSVTVNPSDSIDLGIGYSYALNPFLSATTSLNTRFVSELEIDGRQLEGTDQITADLSLNLTYAFSKYQALDVAFTLGLTDDSTDFGFGISVPFQFRMPLPEWEVGPLRKIFSF